MSHFLLEAASKGDAKKVEDYLDKGADIGWYQKEKRGRTALTEAAINGHLEVARILVDRGADINWRDFAVGFTPLGWASDCNHPSLVEFLPKVGADPNLATHEFFLTPLMVASKNGPPEYDIEGEFLIEVNLINPRRAELITCNEEREHEYLYVMLRRKGRWLLDNKKLRSIGAEWINWSL